MTFTFGTDPEFMLRDKHNNYVSAIRVLPSKASPIAVGSGHAYYDNVMAELSIEPAKTRDMAIWNIRKTIGCARDACRGLELVCQASQEYPESELEHPEAKVVGCSPEMDAYDMQAHAPDAASFANTRLRTAGGHVHLGSPIIQEVGYYPVVHMLDLFLGLPCIALDTDPTSPKRRKLYGNAGRFRITSYGLEYRSIGNFWLQNVNAIGVVYDICEFVLEYCANGRNKRLWEYDYSTLQQDINNEEDIIPTKYQKCIGYDLPNVVEAINNHTDINLNSEIADLVEKDMPFGIGLQIRTLYEDMRRTSRI